MSKNPILSDVLSIIHLPSWGTTFDIVSIRSFILLLFLSVSYGLTGQSADLTLSVYPQDAAGWTILDPSRAASIIYASASSGNDSTGRVYNYPNSAIGDNPQTPSGTVAAYRRGYTSSAYQPVGRKPCAGGSHVSNGVTAIGSSKRLFLCLCVKNFVILVKIKLQTHKINSLSSYIEERNLKPHYYQIQSSYA